MEDGKINKTKDKLNAPKELVNYDYKSTYEQPIHRQNERYSKDTKQYHRKVSNQHHKHFQDDYYDDTNYEGVNERMEKYSKNLHNTIRGAYQKYRPSNYYDYAHRYSEDSYNDVKDKVGQYYEGIRRGYEGAKIGGRVGTLYNGLHGTYKGAKVGANVGYKVQGAKNHAHKYYNDARHKVRESYMIANDVTRKVGEKLQPIKSNIVDYGDDEDYDEDFDEDFDEDG